MSNLAVDPAQILARVPIFSGLPEVSFTIWLSASFRDASPQGIDGFVIESFQPWR